MFIRCAAACLVLTGLVEQPLLAEPQWKAGTAKTVITPDEPLWMAGYGGRDRPVEGKLHDLWVKVLVLEAAGGHRVVVLTSDLLGIPQSIYQNTLKALKGKFGLDPADVMLTSSHTHCGPVLRGALLDIYPLNGEQLRMIEDYSARLERQIVDCVAGAIADLEPARVSAGQGATDFAVNRRNNREPDVPKLREDKALRGPVDHAVPVLAVHSPAGELRAVVFGYACHNTTLSFYQWCGDYAGFAQIELERRHPGAVAMFYMGCGADQNPLPRRAVELSEGYGRKLADAVDDVLAAGLDSNLPGRHPAEESAGKPLHVSPLKELAPSVETAHDLIELDLGPAPTRDELAKMAAELTDYRQRWAVRLLKELDAGQTFRRTYPY
ncbi:MAG TPA: neutral/alkaline non-lysosomal ceramidase N-terminal domain-containing protein, partial [Planctomycetaceae bacterium]|nr:neutral/alkaline non-lysosomal ceramidase N-terminal domain-containing protein [Planctomycetaceae bacterium]